MSDQFIAKSVVSQAVTDATNAVKPLLLAAEAAHPGSEELAALHSALASELANADALLGTGTMHTDGGGTGKGDGEG